MDAHLHRPRQRRRGRPLRRANARGFAEQVKPGVIWRSGSQLIGQLIAWTSTFLVIRLLNPSDYGLVAMTGVILTFLDLFNGWGFASSLVRDERTDRHKIGQAFAMLILMNGALAAAAIRRRAARRRLFPPADGRRSAARPGALLPRQPVQRARPRPARPPARLQAPGADQPDRGGAERADRAGLRARRRSACGPWSRRRRCSGTRGRSAISPRRGCGRSGRASPSPAPARCCATAWRWSASRPAGSCRARPTSSSAGARSTPHRLGIYTTALFLTQILAAKFVPPLNEVAFAAYSRIQARPDMIQSRVPQIGAADHAGRFALLFRAGGDRRAAGADRPRAGNGPRPRRWCRCSPWRCR